MKFHNRDSHYDRINCTIVYPFANETAHAFDQ